MIVQVLIIGIQVRNNTHLKSKLYINAAKAAFKELEIIKQKHAKFESLAMSA